MTIVVKATEIHRLYLHKYYEVDEESVIKQFGSLEEFYEEVANESGDVYNFIEKYAYYDEEECPTMNDGSYQISMELESKSDI